MLDPVVHLAQLLRGWSVFQLRLLPFTRPDRKGQDNPQDWGAAVGLGGGGLALLLLATPTLADTSTAFSANTVAQASFDDLKDVAYWENLCTLLNQARQPAEALVACEQAIQLEPENARLWAAHSGVLLNLEKYPEAIASASRALAFEPQNSLALTYTCMAYTGLNQAETALDSCNEALRVDGNWGNQSPALAWFYRGRILDQAGQYEQALVAYERTLLLEPEQSITLAYQCRTLVNLQRYEAAIAACQQALQGNGDWGSESASLAWFYQGIAHAALAAPEPAVLAYERALALAPDEGQIWLYQGLAFEQVGRYAEALSAYTRAVELQPTSSRAALGQCSNLNRLSQFEAAVAACQQAIQGDDQWWDLGPAQVWYEHSRALAGTEDYEAALASAKRAVRLRSDYAAAWSDLGVIHWYLGQYADAIAAAREALQIDPTFTRAWANLGRFNRSLAQQLTTAQDPAAATYYQVALDAYATALSQAPRDAEIWANQSVVQWFVGDYQAALTSAQQSVSLNPGSAYAWQAQGAALMALQNYPVAQSSYAQAVTLDAENADAWTGLGISSLQLDDRDLGINALQTALKLNPQQPVARRALELLEAQRQAAQETAP